MQTMKKEKHQVLKSVFGYEAFRSLQEQCIDAVLSEQDTVLIMPTGGGKSLCYQIPALLLPGLTIVISPLISLMKDQVTQLKDLGVSAEFLNSSLTSEEYEKNKELVFEGKIKLLFLAPETLFKPDVIDLLTGCHVRCISIDEAHCISEWGHDFRPEYRRIKELRNFFPEAVFLAVTATATVRVREDIVRNLGLNKPKLLLASFDRDNLFYEVVGKNRATDQVLGFLEKFKKESGIIYCFSRKQVDQLSSDLNSFGYKALPYHAGLAPDIRQRNQEQFIRDDVPIMVATIAFGMGINKPNVRFVIHYDLPKNIESYYQETGRAGRDGLPSHCLLVFSEGDGAKIRYFIDQKDDLKQKRVAQDHLNTIIAYGQSRICRRIPLLKYFGEKYPKENCGCCDNCTKEPEDTIDLSPEAIQFLTCLSETEEMFGSVHVINVLRGSQNERVKQYRHDQCAIYGKGNQLSLRQWQNLVRQFIEQKIIAKEPNYGVLSLNQRSFLILSAKEKFLGFPPPADKPKVKPKSKAISQGLPVDDTLFERLRIERKKLADQKGVPPYVIFSDKSLLDMCQRMPKNKSEFSQVFGVGDQKLKRYGDVFLRLINSR